MNDEDTPDVEVVNRPVRRKKTHHVVRQYTEGGADPVLFSHEDQAVVRHYVRTHHPRGREVYTESPDGYREHYSADHAYQGSDGWLPLDEEEE